MRQNFLTAGFLIDSIAGSVVGADGQKCKVRPRTFQLLLLLLNSQGKTLSKDEILEKVWFDVVVGEHVVFQSIAEIRQVFSTAEVIKTIPKQGYCWIAPVSASSPAKAEAQNSGRKEIHAKQSKRGFQALLLGCCLFLFSLLIWTNTQPDFHVSGSVVVLPVKNKMGTNDHNWLTLGAMDQLIQQLVSNNNSGVLHTDYVLEVMARAKAPINDFERHDIDKIFMVSGAALIIELTFSGVPQDYELTYTLHNRQGSDKHVLFTSSVSDGIEQLANILSKSSGIEINQLAANYYSDFANELVANAIEAMRQKSYNKATQLLQASIASEPDNLTAQRLQLHIWVEQGDFVKSNPLVESLLNSLGKQATFQREHIRVLFWSALNSLQQQDSATGLPLLQRAELLAAELNDWLYLAYITEIRGQIAQSQKQFSEAESLYKQAISYHQVLECPYGETNGILNLSGLAMSEGRSRKAHVLLEQAFELIEQRQLNGLKDRALSWQAQLSANAPTR